MSEVFKPRRGKLGAQVFENSHAGIKPTLFYDITIPVDVILTKPISGLFFPDEKPETEVVLEFINVGLLDWRELPGQEFHFPLDIDPDDDVDASIYLGGVHNTVEVNAIRFGRLRGSSLAVGLEMKFNFSCLRPRPREIKKSIVVSWDVSLKVVAAELDAVVAEAHRVVRVDEELSMGNISIIRPNDMEHPKSQSQNDSTSDPEYTTGQLALIFQVASRTVRKWFLAGSIRGRRCGPRNHLRVRRSEVVRFANAHGISLPELRANLLAWLSEPIGNPISDQWRTENLAKPWVQDWLNCQDS